LRRDESLPIISPFRKTIMRTKLADFFKKKELFLKVFPVKIKFKKLGKKS